MSEERERRELEGRIKELEATVGTLTSELVDTTERVRELEAMLDEEGSEEQRTETGAESAWVPATEEVEANGEADAEADGSDSTGTSDDGSSRDADEIIVA